MEKASSDPTLPTQPFPAYNNSPKVWKYDESGAPAFTNSWLNVINNSTAHTETKLNTPSVILKPTAPRARTALNFLSTGYSEIAIPEAQAPPINKRKAPAPTRPAFSETLTR
jgi:hypothetical protein